VSNQQQSERKEMNTTYLVTGVTRDNKRFTRQYSDLKWAMGINLFRGSVWKVEGTKKKLIKRVWN
jgi:hypothetical protein